jgi:hypothetical protein
MLGALLKSMDGHIIAKGELMGTYEKQKERFSKSAMALGPNNS